MKRQAIVDQLITLKQTWRTEELREQVVLGPCINSMWKKKVKKMK